MNKYETIANEVVKNIGGTENIESVTNCMTRLRFTLKNVSKVDVESLEKVKGVQGVVNKNGQFQVVIGSDVSHVCDEIKKRGSFSETVNANSEENVSLVNRVFRCNYSDFPTSNSCYLWCRYDQSCISFIDSISCSRSYFTNLCFISDGS